MFENPSSRRIARDYEKDLFHPGKKLFLMKVEIEKCISGQEKNRFLDEGPEYVKEECFVLEETILLPKNNFFGLGTEM